MNYKAYPKEADTKSRKSRKSLRSKVFIDNKKMKHEFLKARRDKNVD